MVMFDHILWIIQLIQPVLQTGSVVITEMDILFYDL